MHNNIKATGSDYRKESVVIQKDTPNIQLGLPKGRMQEGLFKLLANAGIYVKVPKRGYRPQISLYGFDAKILKPQNIVEMLHAGSRDIGFTGADWVAELQADVVELLDLELDRVDLVAAAPTELVESGRIISKNIVVASEYERITKQWISDKNLDAQFIKSFGATEVFPPEDADCILDITATGETLKMNRLQIIESIMKSSTRLYANPKVLDDPVKRQRCEEFSMLLSSVLDARKRIMVEVNVTEDKLQNVINVLPCMRQPTIAKLNGNNGYAIKAAVPKKQLPEIIPLIKNQGGTDIVVSTINQIII